MHSAKLTLMDQLNWRTHGRSPVLFGLHVESAYLIFCGTEREMAIHRFRRLTQIQR